MVFDAKLLLTGMSSGVPAKQSIPVTASTTTGSTDYIDFGNATTGIKNYGPGADLFLVCVSRGATSGGGDMSSGSFQVALQSDTATNFATALKTHATSSVRSTFKAGEAIVVPFPYEDLSRYVRGAIINGSTALNAAHDVIMFITDSPQAWADLPDGI